MRIKKLAIVLLITGLFFWCTRELVSFAFPFNYREVISEYCAEYDLDPAWVSAIIRTESRYNPEAVSHKGAIGLMQVLEGTGEWVSSSEGMGVIDLYHPRDNIRVGCAYLRMLLERYDSEFYALCAYNAGEGRVDSWLEEAEDEEEFRALLYEETSDYCEKIERFKKVYSILYWRNVK